MDATTQQEQNAAVEQKISEKSTTLVSWARVIRQTLIKLDIDPEPLFERANIDIALLEHSDARIPVEKMTALWHLAGSASQLPDFGLHVARQVTPATFHALGIAAMASDNAADAISRMIRYAPSMTDGIVIRLDASDGHFYLIFELQEGYQKFADACFEAVLGAIMHFGRAYIQLDIVPDAIHFQHELKSDIKIYEDFFRCPVFFSQKHYAMVSHDIQKLSQSFSTANPDLAKANDNVSEQYLRQLEAEKSVSGRVRMLILKNLNDTPPSMGVIAKAMHVSERKLQTMLQNESTQYKRLLDECRTELATRYLQDGSLNISQIAWKLGFSDVSSFSRAFKRWTGKSPKRFADAC